MKIDIKTITTGAFALTCGLTSCTASAQEPNIVIILADDMGYGDVGALNPASKIPTPNIDGIARAGVAFTDAHSTSSVSTPSRYSLLTGRYNWRSTMKQGVGGGYAKPLIDEGRTTLAGMLRQRGYTTACIGKWHLGWDWAKSADGKGNDSVDFSRPITEGPTERGFDYFYGISASLDMAPYVYVENDRATMVPDSIAPDFNDDVVFWREGPISADFEHAKVFENFTDRACNYIAEKAKGDRPYMLYLPITAPHTPVIPSEEFVGKSGLNLYADFVMMVDSEVGRVLDAIERSGESKNTIVVFATDNGCAPYIHPDELVEKGHHPSGEFRGYKSDIYDGGHRIPLLMKWTAKLKPHTIDQTVCLTDLMATFAAITGYELASNEGEDSFDLGKALFKPKYKSPLRDITVHSSNDGSLAVRSGEWKLITVAYSGGWGHPTKKESKGLPSVQLYNMKDDPAETVNLYESRPDVVAELLQKLTACIENGRSTPGEVQPNDPPHWWKQLNWIDPALKYTISNRPAEDDRLFRSEAVENEIVRIQSLITHPKLRWMLGNCFPNTLDTTVYFRDDEDGQEDTFVYTGDIPAMWLRDSGAQVYPYVQFADRDEHLRKMIAGVIRRQFKCIAIDPYANAFLDPADPDPDHQWMNDGTDMKPELHERKYEIDSHCYPIRLAYEYWRVTGDTSIFDEYWLESIALTLQTFREQQRKSGIGPYSFTRRTDRQLDTVVNGGKGNPVNPVGLIASVFRPSDDATTFLFLVPSNFFAVTSLRKAAEILTKVNDRSDKAAECLALAAEVEQALKEYAVVTHPEYGDIYAFEVDGFGNAFMMDDANVPSLLAMPYLGDIDRNDPIYENTRRFVWSTDNPYFFRGKAGEGIGGPHIGYDMAWPMSIMMKAFTSTDDKEIAACMQMLLDTDAETGFMHESFNVNDPYDYTRSWFAWQNTLFGELVIKLVAEGKLELLNSLR